MKKQINEVLPENELDEIIDKFKGRPGALLKTLEEAQKRNTYNYLPQDTLNSISAKLSVTIDEVMKFATTFSYFNIEPQGKNSIVVCCGISCDAKRSKLLLDEVGPLLGYPPLNIAKEGSYITPDYLYTIKYHNCIGDCDNAPLISVNGEYHNKMNYYKMAKILNKLKND